MILMTQQAHYTLKRRFLIVENAENNDEMGIISGARNSNSLPSDRHPLRAKVEIEFAEKIWVAYR